MIWYTAVCRSCNIEALPINSRNVIGCHHDVEVTFCYQGNAVFQWGLWQCHCLCGLRYFRKLLPVLTTMHFSSRLTGQCVWCQRLLGYAPWYQNRGDQPNNHDLKQLYWNDHMIHWICGTKQRLNTLSINIAVRWHCWYYFKPSHSSTHMLWPSSTDHILHQFYRNLSNYQHLNASERVKTYVSNCTLAGIGPQ